MSKHSFSLLMILAGLGASSSGLYGRSIGAPSGHTGAPMDFGGRECTACHRTFAPANSDARGRLTVQAVNYKPGTAQTIKVRLEHPTATRWGFQLTALALNATSKAAGTFTVVPGQILVRCPDALLSVAPCNGNVEYATHEPATTFVGRTQSAEWEVEWTPPISEVGDIVLFASGLAADNSGSNTGDYVFTTSVRLKADAACNLTARPSVRSAANAASFATSVAGNSMATLFGLNFQTPGLERTAGPGDIDEATGYRTSLGCVAVDVGGTRAPVTYVRPDQINFQVPTFTATGTVPVRVILNPDKPNQLVSDVLNMTVAQFSPAFFTFGSSKSIAALTTDFKYLADPAVVPDGVKAKAGDVVLLYGTGFGPSEPVWRAGELVNGQPRITNSTLRITIGGTTLSSTDILYAGLAPGSISGLYQFNLRVPASATSGNVPVVVSIGGVSTQADATIPVQ